MVGMRMKLVQFISRTVFVGLLAAVGGTVRSEATYSNNYYILHVANSAEGFGYGTWNALTGPFHPGGSSRDILFSGTTTQTNYSSLRIYRSPGVTATYAPMIGTGLDLDNYFTSEGISPLGPPGQGHRTVWTIPAEGIVLTQDVFLRPGMGFATYDNSAIIHTMEIRNTGVSTLRVGFRNLYDWALSDGGGEDGPNASLELVCGGAVIQPATTLEFSHAPVTADVMRLAVAPGTPTYQAMMALNYDPGFWPGLPITVPDQVAFVSWPDAYDAFFDYTVIPSFDTTSDSATLTWFGRTDAQAISIPAGTSKRITQAIFAVTVGDCGPPDVNSAISWDTFE